MHKSAKLLIFGTYKLNKTTNDTVLTFCQRLFARKLSTFSILLLFTMIRMLFTLNVLTLKQRISY